MLVNQDAATLDEQLQQLAERVGNSSDQETTRVAAAGSRQHCWLVRITGKYDYNWYNVEHVDITTPGVSPAPIASTATPAVNIAESFETQGSLSAGIYAVMWRVGETNVIYVEP